MTETPSDIDSLLEKVRHGDQQARNELLEKYRGRLRQMIALRLDRRLAARVDPSDVIQETLAEADQKLSDYLKTRPVPFYLWLRKLAWEKLIMLHRRHLDAGKRTVKREKQGLFLISEESLLELAERLIDRGSSPSAGVQRQERKEQLETALLQMKEKDREILVLRYLEHLSIAEIAATMNLSEGAVKLRQLRALERLRTLLGNEEEQP